MRLLYFAWVRESAGCAEEELSLPRPDLNIEHLRQLLHARGGRWAQTFADPSRLRVAVNQEQVGWEQTVSDQDEVAFFPPMTGG